MALEIATVSPRVMTLRAALRKEDEIGVIVYRGASALDGEPIVAIATNFQASENDKTGNMVQTFIMREDIAPHHALKTGDDASVCGDCEHRPILAKQTGKAPCYVKVFHAPLSVWRAYGRGRYVDITAWSADEIAAIFAGYVLRIGTYGDPGACPDIWHAMAKRALRRTGYTHQARNPVAAGLRELCMASADSETDASELHAMGWRTFRVAAPTGWEKMGGEGLCPASEEAGKRTVCADCALCSGTGEGSKGKASIMIPDHSLQGIAAKRRAQKVAMAA